mmetsp:Transcript_66129/g.190828  ORF Transcript_66129/g.190828 Transcript_66129/m.190828 type:complete len:221 (-) Transcript_66129:120-782(-)
MPRLQLLGANSRRPGPRRRRLPGGAWRRLRRLLPAARLRLRTDVGDAAGHAAAAVLSAGIHGLPAAVPAAMHVASGRDCPVPLLLEHDGARLRMHVASVRGADAGRRSADDDGPKRRGAAAVSETVPAGRRLLPGRNTARFPDHGDVADAAAADAAGAAANAAAAAATSVAADAAAAAPDDVHAAHADDVDAPALPGGLRRPVVPVLSAGVVGTCMRRRG